MKLDFISARGDILTLSENKYFTIANVDGMTAATTSISSNVIGGFDGDTVNNVQAHIRDKSCKDNKKIPINNILLILSLRVDRYLKKVVVFHIIKLL